MQQTSDRFPKSFIVLCSLFALTRLALLWFNEAEFTDGYILFNWSFRHGDRWHPLYPVLLQTLDRLLDPILSGRLISIICGLLTLPVLWNLTNRVYGRRPALYAGYLFFVSPQLLWVETRVLTESLFVLVALATILYFIRVYEEDRPWDLALLFFLSGLSMLTRPESVAFIPLILIGLLRMLQRQRFKRILLSLPSLAPWLLFLVWSQMRASGANYQDVFSFSLNTLTFGRCLLYLVSYLEVYPYVVTYAVFLLFIVNRARKLEPQNRIWIFTLIYFHVVWFGMLAAYYYWTTRFLIFPTVLILIEAGSSLALLEKTLTTFAWRTVAVFVFLFCILFSMTALFLQRETYADVKDSALFVRNKRTNQRVFSDEYFKVSYYLRAPAILYSRDAKFLPGDIVILHSFHTPLKDEVIELSRRYKLSLVYSTSATTVPLLANGLVAKSAENNLPLVLQERFTVQKFDSIVLQILLVK